MQQLWIPQMVKRLNLIFEREMGRYMTAYGLTPAQADLLAYIIDHTQNGAQLCARDIEAALHLSHATTAGVLARLAEKGFLSFAVSERDNRYKYIATTDQTEQLNVELKRCMSLVEKQLLESLPEQECDALRATLDKLLRQLDEAPAKE